MISDNNNKGKDSAWHYTKNNFREVITTILEKDVTLADVLSTFREIGVLPKRFKDMTVQEVRNDSVLIGEVHAALRKMLPPTRFDFEYKIADREKELVQMLVSNFDNVDVGKARTKIISGRHQDTVKDTDFCYAIEAAIAPEKDIEGETVKRAGKIQFVGCINDGTSLDNGESYFANGIFNWKENKSGIPMSAKGIKQLLAECGFASNISNTKRRVPCVLFLNLKTYTPNWMGSAGKTEIDLRPYQKKIAEVVSSLAYKMPTYHGKGVAARYHSTGLRDKQREDKSKAVKIFEQFLRERHHQILADPTLKLKDRWNTSTPVYRVRPELEKAGLEELTRRYLQGLVRDICKNRLHVNREELGIYEEARALMYFKGKIYPVSFEQLREIKHLGSHIFMVEKHGPVDLEIAFAERYGVAMCETGGFLTDNAKELCKLATEEGGNMVIVTDDDYSGWLMASKVRDAIPRIGISLRTLRKLNIPIDKVSETGKATHKESAKLLYKGGWKKDKETNDTIYIKGGYIPEEDWTFLSSGDQRIEIDNVIGYIGAERFWEDFVMAEFRELFPNSDIARSVEVPEYVMPKCLEKLNEKVKKQGIEILKKIGIEGLQNRLANFNGCFLFDRTDNVSDGLQTIPKYEETLTDHSRHIIESDENIKPLLDQIEELAKDDDSSSGGDNNTSSSSPPPSAPPSSTTRPPIPPPRSARIVTENIVADTSEDYQDDDYDYNYEQDSDCNDRKYSFIPKYVMPEELEELNNLVKERGIKIAAPERKRLIRKIQKGGMNLMLFVDGSPNKHIKEKIESHGSLKPILNKIEDLTLEYDEDYQAWLKERDKEEKQRYGTSLSKTERRSMAEVSSRGNEWRTYCTIKLSREYNSAATCYLPHDATFPPDYTRVYTHTDERGHAYTADEWDRKQRGALTEEEFEAQIIRNLPGTFNHTSCPSSGPFADDANNDGIWHGGCCYVVWNWGGERDQFGHRYCKKFAGEEWVKITIEGKKLEYRTAPQRNIQYSAFLQHQIALRFNH